MYNLIKSFMSFDKLIKERLVPAFFWLALIVILLSFFSDALAAVRLGPLAGVADFFNFFIRLLLAVVSLRLVCELAIDIFRINDNLSPDGGRSETADVDPVHEARQAAKIAARKAREATSTVVSRTKSAAEKVEEEFDDLGDKVAGASKSVKKTARRASQKAKSAAHNASHKVETATRKTRKPSALQATAKATKTKAKTVKAKSAKTSIAKTKAAASRKTAVRKSGPKVRLKKDGTPYKKPGKKPTPKPKK